MKNDKMRMLKADIIDCWVNAEKERDEVKRTAAEATDLAAEFNRELHEIDAENDRLKIRVRSLLDFIDTLRESHDDND